MNRQMNRQFHKRLRVPAASLCGILLAAAMIFGMAHPVMAQDFVLPVTQTMDVSGGKAASAGDISITYTLTAEDGAPMPDGVANGKYIFSIAGNERVQLAFSYDTAGDYSYVLERTDVTGVGGGTIDGDPEKVRIVNSVNTEDRRITAAITILEGTYDIGKKMTECRFDYKCAFRQITGTLAPSAGPSGHNGTGKVSGRSGGGSAGGNGSARASSVKTGDESDAAFYLVMLLAATAVMTVCMRRRLHAV